MAKIDDANFTPSLGTYTELKPFRFWCQKVMPLVYDDSLSYYELLCKVVDYLNKTMEDVDTLHTDVDSLLAAYNQLQQYVNDYFNSLDVQEEINNKLDDMAETGALSAIIAPLVLNVAVPLFVSSTSEMTDHGRVYVLTSTGFVYIWNGTSWYNTGMNYTENFQQYILVSGTLSDGTDANDITTNGVWNLNGSYTYTNIPFKWGLFESFNLSGVTYQRVTYGSTAETKYRFHLATGWSEWLEYDLHPNAMDASTNYLANNTDLDNMETTGAWNLSGANTYSNVPASVPGLLEVYNVGLPYQRYTCMGGGLNGSQYIRFRLTSGWSEWYALSNFKVLHSNNLLESSDLNDATVAGTYGLSGGNTYTNSPITLGMLFVSNNSGVIYQIAIDGSRSLSNTGITPNNGNTYFRAYYSGSWSNWSKISVDKLTYADRLITEVGSILYDENTVTIKSFESGYYSNQNGTLQSSESYYRTKTLCLAKPKLGIRLHNSALTNNVYVVWFDADFNYIKYGNLVNRGDRIPVVAPPNAMYFGVNYNLNTGESEPTNLVLDWVDGSNILSINNNFEENGEILKVSPRVINNNGTFSAESDTFKCFFIANPQFKQAYVNFNSLNQMYCLDYEGNNVTPTDYEQITVTGRVYTLPENVALVGFNVYINNGYVNFIYDSSQLETEREINKFNLELPRINGKRIACIGDSLTYLDGREINDQPRFMGYQAILRRCGAIVNSFGYSGRPYAQNTEGNNIADVIVDGNTDLTNYDIIILFGGSNDVRLSTTVGDANTSYDSKNTDSATFIGAIGKLINYCREQNPNVEIFISTITPSTDASRGYDKITTYNNAIKETANFWNVPVIDTFQLVNWQPGGNLSTFCYDSTHPNEKGMKRIGRIFANYINHYMSMVE